MNPVFHPEAEAELNAAIDWYEERQPGLGLDLAAEVQVAIERAMQLPEAWSELAPGIRRVLTHRFPYGILYAQAGTTLHVLAVMHLSRQPGYWESRY
jgi:plasmid stabilization system protein ParE